MGTMSSNSQDSCSAENRVLDGTLIHESAPGFAFFVAEGNTVAVGQAAEGPSATVAERVTKRAVGALFRDSPPDMTVVVAHADEVVVPETVHTRLGCFFFKAEEATGRLAMCAMPFVDHNFIIGAVKPV